MRNADEADMGFDGAAISQRSPSAFAAEWRGLTVLLVQLDVHQCRRREINKPELDTINIMDSRPNTAILT